MVLFGLLGVLVVALPAVIGRLLRTDPLWTPDGWSRRRSHRIHPESRWAPRFLEINLGTVPFWYQPHL